MTVSAALQSVLAPAGVDAAIIAQLAWVMFIAGGVILLAVMALLVLGVRSEARPVRSTGWIWGLGVVFPVVVLSALLVWSTWRSAQLTPQSSQQALSIGVTAKMWWWEVRYDDPGGGAGFVTANEIHVPTGRRVHLGLSSTDVIHSLWIPALAGKKDMVPGRVTALTFIADKPGVYRGQCAEYCGEQHARMALHVVAHTPDAYAAWVANQRQGARAAAGPLLQKGRQAFLEQKCSACHTIRGVAESPGLGPDLTHVGSRMHIAAGTLRNHQGTLAGWIADPQAIKPGAFMPAAGDIDGETLRALAAYLEQLK